MMTVSLDCEAPPAIEGNAVRLSRDLEVYGAGDDPGRTRFDVAGPEWVVASPGVS